MKWLSIYSSISLSLALGIVTIYLLDIKEYASLLWLSIALFTFLELSFNLYRRFLLREDDHGRYIGSVLMYTLMKIVLSFVLIFIYNRESAPTQNTFLLVFLIPYFTFTVIESWNIYQYNINLKNEREHI